MLYKNLAIHYGNSLNGRFRPEDDIIAAKLGTDAPKEFRQQTLDQLAQARIFLLDVRAAEYVDSFHESLGDGTDIGNLNVTAYIQDVDLVEEIMWVEYDHSALLRSRLARGYGFADPRINPEDFGVRGFLLNNTAPDAFRVTPFSSLGHGTIIDPSIRLRFEKGLDGRTNFDTYRMEPIEHMLEFYRRQNVSPDIMGQIINQIKADATYDLLMPFVLSALITSKDDGILSEFGVPLSEKEAKTAHKFGKTWMTDTLKSHATIRIGPSAEKHLTEQAGRREHQHAVAAGRAPVIEHWVSQHERHLRSGKIVMVSGHKRGRMPDSGTPIHVLGPVAERYDGPGMGC